ncbi:glycosyltransferase [Saccharothrix syringae]|uniref:Glycosyltransferase n=1 Tax=Saccharothrix syringae TaxID=103733 RepID=A0A5Q0H0Y7_SACSY|nr:glycosyltransferase [Saccharothrix syringae]QFZ19839.1 glycosyltransferase [Saccharothrix syringae]
MSRYLLVVPPLVGHVNPLVAVAAELAGRGHEVAWAGHAELVRRLAGPRARVLDCALPPAEGLDRPPTLTGPAAFRFLWRDFFVPLADAMADGVAAAIEAFRPDLVLADQHAVAGPLVAERLGVPCATSASTSAELVDPLAGLPKVRAWLGELLAELRGRIGDPAADGDPRYPAHGVVAFTTRDLVGDVDLPGGVRLVGPAVTARPGGAFPWDRLDPGRRLVLVSLGTANADAGARFLGAAAEALAARPHVQGVVVDPGGLLAAVPPEVLVFPHVPQLELLARCAAVVCHAGHNTVCESLWHGVPLVLAPIRDDQPVVADQVVAAGAGVRVRFGRVGAEGLGAALDAVLDPAGGHRAAAAAIGRSFRGAGGAVAAADHLERLTTVAVR